MSTSHLDKEEGVLEVDLSFRAVVTGIAARADHTDRHPSFPEQSFRQLAQSGILAIPIPSAPRGAVALSPRNDACCGP